MCLFPSAWELAGVTTSIWVTRIYLTNTEVHHCVGCVGSGYSTLLSTRMHRSEHTLLATRLKYRNPTHPTHKSPSEATSPQCRKSRHFCRRSLCLHGRVPLLVLVITQRRPHLTDERRVS